MINGNYFRDQLENIIDNPDSYTREELHDAFLEITERYLNELISTLNYEQAIISSLGEEEGNKIIEKAADKKETIKNLLDFIESKYKTRYGGDDDSLPESID